MINMNKLAREITLKEGLKKSVNIAQVKEIMHLLLKELKGETLESVVALFKKV